MRDIKQTFGTEGFCQIKEYFDLKALGDFESQITSLFHMQARKIGDYREKVIATNCRSPFEALSAIVEMMETTDKEALYQVQKLLPSCQALRSLFTPHFMEMCADLLGSSPFDTLLDGPALFVNRPNTQRLLYKWHSEAHYYPKRRRFLNVWLPVFTDKGAHNGSMAIMPKSHTRHWDFAEYTGYNKDTENKKNHFVQFEVPANHLTEFTPHTIQAKRGDVILFDRNLIHTSNPNASGEYSFAVVARVWDPSDDLTLSGNLAATPYGGDIGRANLVVSP